MPPRSNIPRLTDIVEAIELIRRAIAINPQYAEAFNNLGLVLKAAGQGDASVSAFRQAIANRPNNADTSRQDPNFMVVSFLACKRH